MVHADFMLSVLQLAQRARNDGFRLSVVNSKSSIIAQSRNFAVKGGLAAGADWLLFLDSDMVFPVDTLSRLLAHQVAIVGATYARKGWPITFIGTRLDGALISPADSGLISAARMPAGCLLIKASVFESLKPPYFRCAYDEESGTILGEDFWFSERVRELGFEVWCDMALSRQIEHIGAFRFHLKDAS